MTKMKSKKMTKSTFAIIIMAVAMVAMLAFGGTYAYFTATANNVAGTIKTGYVKLTTDATVTSSFATTVLPGDKMLTSNITYTVDTTDANGNYVFVKVALSSDIAELQAELDEIDLSKIELGDNWQAVTSAPGVFYYSDAVVKTGQTNPTVVISKDALVLPTTVTDNWSQGNTAASDGKLMNADITLTIQAQSVQVSNQPSSATAATLAAAATWADVTVS